MTGRPINSAEHHKNFLASKRKHILMITNHGIHQWKIIPGLPDTGGQNVFVNHFTSELVNLGYKITIVNRGGYPHPQTKEMQVGVNYKDDNQRILYLQDGRNEFVRKEDMDAQIPALVEDLKTYLEQEKTTFDLILSHYWDAAKIGIEINRGPRKVKHVWTPHSVGTVKKRNMESSQWANLRVDERIAVEKSLVRELDGIAATSSLIGDALRDDYGCPTEIFLPPCVDPNRYFPHKVAADNKVWPFVANLCGLSPQELQQMKIVTEISRTDRTKRKDILIKAFAKAHEKEPNSMLVVAIDEHQKELCAELKGLIQSLGIAKWVAPVGSIWDVLPDLYAITSIYCTPSVMEGFGMSIQEAAATKVPAVSSSLVPFAQEYLLGKEVVTENAGGKLTKPVRRGEGAFVVEPDDIDGFAYSLEQLLSNDSLREKMGEAAYRITIPYFTWPAMVKSFLSQIGASA